MESIEPTHRGDFAGNAKRSSLKAGALLIFLMNIMPVARAQNFAEWFEQKKYLLEQIAALQAFSGGLKQGYQIANHGLGAISGSLDSEHRLHRIYYQKLSGVSPAVRDNPQVAEILVRQQDIIRQLDILTQIRGLTPGEEDHLEMVKEAVLNDCNKQLNGLKSVLTDNLLIIGDQERLVVIAKIYNAMEDNYRFTTGYVRQVKTYSLQKNREANGINNERQLYGLH